MQSNPAYKLGLLYLLYLIIISDEEISGKELAFLDQIKKNENIDDDFFHDFRESLNHKNEQDIFHEGIDLMNQCSDKTKTRAFTLLYRMAQVDGKMHAKEVRLLLYSSRLSKTDISSIISTASNVDFNFDDLDKVV